MKNKLTIIIVGATGDLAQKKLFPALFSLFQHKKIPEEVSIIAFSRRDWDDDEFRAYIEGTFEYTPEFLSRITYHQGFFEQPQSFHSLAGKVDDDSEKIIFLSIAPDSYPNVITHLGEALKKNRNVSNIKLLIEKPFGKDLASARELQKVIDTYFESNEIFRVDHYLGKEALHRFSELCTPGKTLSLVPNEIKSVHAKLLQNIDVEGRHDFYDQTGALLDVGQNHVLEMLATVVATFLGHCEGEDVQREREEIIKNFSIKNEACEFIRGQYEGYTEELGKDSETETYFKATIFSNENLFKDAPITLEAGKALLENVSEIVITFKDRDEPLIVRIQPDPYIILSKKAKIIVAEEMGPYEHIFLGAINNDQFYFPSLGEIYASWKLTDELKKKLAETPLQIYKKGSIDNI